MTNSDHLEVSGLLPAYAGGRLSGGERLRVERHLAGCRSCEAELATWRGVRDVLRETAAVEAPPAHVLAVALERIDAQEHARDVSHSDRRSVLVEGSQVLVAQLALVRRRLWLGSAAMMVLGFALALAGTVGTGPSLVLQLAAPAVAAWGVSLIYGPEADPSLELVRSTPTSPKLVLLARLALVFGYDLFLALTATFTLVWLGDATSVWSLVLDWLGPMLFLSGLSLLLTVRWGPSVGIAIGLALWTLRLLIGVAGSHLLGSGVSDVVVNGWSTNALTLMGTVALLVLAVSTVQRQERLA